MTRPVAQQYRHPCPGCDGRRKRRDGDALCRPCYFRLPKDLRSLLWNPVDGWAAALAVVVGWLDDHPVGGAT